MGGFFEKMQYITGPSSLEGQSVKIHKQKYFLEKQLGKGGFGAVYRARAPNGEPVAVKIVDISNGEDSAPLVESYLNEVKHLNRLRKRTSLIVKIYDFDFDPRTGQAFLVMELADQSLDKLIESIHEVAVQRGESGYIPAYYRNLLWKSIVAVVFVLHRNGTVHLDLKPANFLVFGQKLKIADLGISKHGHKPAIGGLGSYPYSAPEVMNDEPGARRNYGHHADIWSLGVILYYMTYGKLPGYSPYASNPPPGRLPTRDRNLQDLLQRLLVLNPAYRITLNGILRHPYTYQQL